MSQDRTKIVRTYYALIICRESIFNHIRTGCEAYFPNSTEDIETLVEATRLDPDPNILRNEDVSHFDKIIIDAESQLFKELQRICTDKGFHGDRLIKIVWQDSYIF